MGKVLLYQSTLVNALVHLNETNPHFVIIEEGKRAYTVQELYNYALHLAKGMAKKGVKQHSRIVIAMPPSFLFLAYIIACTMNAATIVLIDPEMGRENYLSKLKQINPQFAVLDKRLLLIQEHPIIKFLALKFKGNIPSFPHIKGLTYFTDNTYWPILKSCHTALEINKLGKKCEVEWQVVDEKNDAFIVYTSGTLAIPKGVVHSYESFNASIKALSKAFDFNGLRIGASLPHFVFLAIACQATAVIMPSLKSNEKKLTFIKDKQIEVLFGPPSDFKGLVEYCKQSNIILPSTLKYMLLGSAPVLPSFLKQLIEVTDSRTAIFCIYGMTEHLFNAYVDARKKVNHTYRHDWLGTFVKSIEYKIENDGELLINGPQLFKHYLHLNARADFHATGDLVMVQDGQLFLTGRKKNMLIRRNFNIYPELYEQTIMKIKGVNEAVMIGIYDEAVNDEKIILVVDGNIEKQKLMRLLSNGEFSIDKEALPDDIIFMSIPHSGRQSKVNRNVLIEKLKQK